MKRTAAFLGLLAVLAGVPAILLVLSGNPHLPSLAGVSLRDNYMSPQVVLDVLALVSWIAWAYLALAAFLRFVAVVAFPAETAPGRALLAVSGVIAPSPLRHLLDVLIGGALVASTFSPRGIVVSSSAHAATASAQKEPSSTATPGTPPLPTTQTYRVRAGDSLWRIAEKHLGSGFRWKEIFELNRGRRFDDGRRLESSRLIYPGWTLRLPIGPHAGKRIDVPADPSAPEHILNIEAHTEPVERETSHSPANAKADAVQSAQPDAAAQAPPVVRLPSGSIVGISFASGLLTAHLLGTLRRRHSSRPLTESAEKFEEEANLVYEARFAGVAPQSAHLLESVDAVVAVWRAAHGRWPRIAGAFERPEGIDVLLHENESSLPRATGGSMSPGVRFDREGEFVVAHVGPPFKGAGERDPALLERGLLAPLGYTTDGAAAHVGLIEANGLSVTGPRARQFTQAVLLALSVSTSPDQLRITSIGDDLDLAELPHADHISSWSDAQTALRELKLECLRRARMMFEEGASDIWSHLEVRPDEKFPALVIVTAEPPDSLRATVKALAAEIAPLGGALIGLGWTSPARVQIHADDELNVQGAITERLHSFRISAQAVGDAVATIKTAWLEQTDTNAVAESPSTPLPGETHAIPSIPLPVPRNNNAPTADPPLPGTRLELIKPVPPDGVAAVLCLGPFQVIRAGRPVQKGWRTRSREMLAYLAAHPGGVPKDRLIELFWPNDDLDKANREFERAAHFIRKDARGPEDSRHYIDKTLDSWHLVTDEWWVDAWEMTRLIEQVARTEDPEEKRELLTVAIACYHGQFCEDCYFPWAEPVRLRFRDMVVRACGRLAELLNDIGDVRQALDVLDLALIHDPLCEELARLAIRIEVSAGRRLAATQRYERLAETLRGELGVEPDPETEAIMRQLDRAYAVV